METISKILSGITVNERIVHSNAKIELINKKVVKVNKINYKINKIINKLQQKPIKHDFNKYMNKVVSNK